jgi:hypothetical protein
MRNLLVIFLITFISCNNVTSTNNAISRVCINNKIKTVKGEFISHKNDYYIFQTKSSNYKIYLMDNIKVKIAFNMIVKIDIKCDRNKWYLSNF